MDGSLLWSPYLQFACSIQLCGSLLWSPVLPILPARVRLAMPSRLIHNGRSAVLGATYGLFPRCLETFCLRPAMSSYHTNNCGSLNVVCYLFAGLLHGHCGLYAVLARSSSQSAIAIACCACQFVRWFLLTCCFSACTMTARRTNNSLAASLDGENSSSNTLLHAESSGPSSLASAMLVVVVRLRVFALQCQSRQPHSSRSALFRCLPAYCTTNLTRGLRLAIWPRQSITIFAGVGGYVSFLRSS